MSLRGALVDMVWQFAYRSHNKRQLLLHTGGLSDLERAFSELGWDDPYIFTGHQRAGLKCEVKGCPKWGSNGGPLEDDGPYIHYCSKVSHGIMDDGIEYERWVAHREKQRDDRGVLSGVQWVDRKFFKKKA